MTVTELSYVAVPGGFKIVFVDIKFSNRGQSEKKIMSHFLRKAAFWVFDKVQLKSGCTPAKDGQGQEFSDLGSIDMSIFKNKGVE